MVPITERVESSAGRNSEPKRGWLYALRWDPHSKWGSIVGFFKNIDGDSHRDPFEIDSDVWGKVSELGLHPAQGDGFAFYHASRAKFPPLDPHKRRPSISLIGRLVDIKIEGQELKHIRIQIDRNTLNQMRNRPIVRNPQTEYLFKACMGGQTATLYEIPPQVWKVFAGFLGLSVEKSSRSAGAMGTSITPPRRVEASILRVVRDTKKAGELKLHYDYQCQICRERIEWGDGRFYAEVHHIRPLGGNHGGQDIWENMLVLCPTHHAMFDLRLPRFLSVDVVRINGKDHPLTSRHQLDLKNIRYHNELVGRLGAVSSDRTRGNRGGCSERKLPPGGLRDL